MDDLFSVLDAARADGKIGVYGVCGGNAEIIGAVVDANRCEVVETAVEPLVTSRLQASLGSVGDSRRVEVVANHVLAGHLSPPAAERARQADTLLDKKLNLLTAERGVPRANLLIRHAAALHNVRVVLTGTSNPAHLAQNVAALELPVTSEDLLA